MKKLLILAILSITLLFFDKPTLAQSPTPQAAHILYYGTGCPHCAIVEEYIESNQLTQQLNLQTKEIYFNQQNAKQFTQTLQSYGIPPNQQGVPALVTPEKAIVGDRLIIDYLENVTGSSEATSKPRPTNAPAKQLAESTTNNPLTLLMVIAAAAVDAINPCAFAVLIILMSTVLASKKAKKALYSGVAFSSAIFISYLLMGLGLYHAIGLSGIASTFINAIGVLALILGLLNLKDWLWYGKGILMEVPMSWRPKLKQLLQSVTSPLGAFVIGFAVSLFLLPCTSGPYIVILGMLANQAQRTQAVGYLVFYNLIFVAPMLGISFLVYKGLKPQKIEAIRQKNLRNLHLIAGLILLGMGVYLLFFTG